MMNLPIREQALIHEDLNGEVLKCTHFIKKLNVRIILCCGLAHEY